MRGVFRDPELPRFKKRPFGVKRPYPVDSLCVTAFDLFQGLVFEVYVHLCFTMILLFRRS